MNACELTRLETKVRASLRALWRGERETLEAELVRRAYKNEVGHQVYADTMLTERAAFDAEQAQKAKRVR